MFQVHKPTKDLLILSALAGCVLDTYKLAFQKEEEKEEEDVLSFKKKKALSVELRLISGKSFKLMSVKALIHPLIRA